MKPSRRQKELKETTLTITNLESSLNKAKTEEESEGIKELLGSQRAKRKMLKKAENSRKKRWRRKNMKNNFQKNPFGIVKDILSRKSRCHPEVSVETLNVFLEEVTKDELRDSPLGPLEGLGNIKEPTVKFKENNLQERYLMEIVKKNATPQNQAQIRYRTRCIKNVQNYVVIL